MSTEGQAIEPPKRFVWWSTDKSVADGVASALACLEVVVAVAAYWAIAIYFETTTHLWVNICVAPLSLLRSEQSTSLTSARDRFTGSGAPDFNRSSRAIRNAICGALLYWGTSECLANSVSCCQCLGSHL
jgi:hypothetical protein